MSSTIILSDQKREILRVRLQLLRDSAVASNQCEIIEEIAAILGVSLTFNADKPRDRRPPRRQKKGDAA
jgi:hypothetical protein